MLVRKPPPATTSACGASSLASPRSALIIGSRGMRERDHVPRSACSTWAMTASEGRQAFVVVHLHLMALPNHDRGEEGHAVGGTWRGSSSSRISG